MFRDRENNARTVAEEGQRPTGKVTRSSWNPIQGPHRLRGDEAELQQPLSYSSMETARNERNK